MIEAHAFFAEIVKPETTADCRRWSFYTALRFPSSISVPERRGRLRLKNFGLDSVPNADNWRAKAHGCVCKVMVAIAGKCAACERDGL